MRTRKNLFYNAILAERHINAPTMKEARRDLDRAFYSARLAALSATL